MGPVEDPETFVSAVISQSAFDKITKGITQFTQQSSLGQLDLLIGGNADSSIGWYIEPTLIQVPLGTNAMISKEIPLLNQELFGPVLAAVIYPDNEYLMWLNAASTTSPFALTAGV